MAFKLDQAKLDKAKGAIDELFEELSDFRAEWEDKSERWQEGEKGQAALQWLDLTEDQLDQAISALDDIALKPEDS